MEYKKLEPTTDQHTVPRCYLKNFSDDNTFIFHKELDKNNQLIKKKKEYYSLKVATVVDNFYTVTGGNEPMVVETLVYAREIEGRYPKLYELLINQDTQGFDMLQRTWILTCLLSMHCRTPKQFQLFEAGIPSEHYFEIEKIRDDYKAAHILEALTSMVKAHEFKTITVAKITDSSEFITSDNPVLIIGPNGELLNHKYQEQFNTKNVIIIPLDKKHCVILKNGTDKNGISIQNKCFYNKILRENVDISFTQKVNFLMVQSADKYFFGSKQYVNAYFSFWFNS